MIRRRRAFAAAAAMALAGSAAQAASPDVSRGGGTRPNIVLMFPDNLGFGEVGAYGGVREGLQPASNRSSAIFLRREGDVMAVKWHDWKLWYAYQTALPDPDPGNLLRLFDLRVDPREEIDVADFYPWVISAMDGVVADYEKSLEAYPPVPASIDDPYVPPPRGSGNPVRTYERTDRGTLGPRSEALPNLDFSGAWSAAVISAAPPTGRPPSLPIPDLGSGWGDEISIVHRADLLTVERVVFLPREVQPPVRYRFALDGLVLETHRGRALGGPASTTRTVYSRGYR